MTVAEFAEFVNDEFRAFLLFEFNSCSRGRPLVWCAAILVDCGKTSPMSESESSLESEDLQ